MSNQYSEAAEIILQGGVVAYPTESCFGLGCDYRNITAIKRILNIKRRRRDKGLIVVSDHVSRVLPLIESIPHGMRDSIYKSWPGPNTWLIPAKKSTSPWLKGEHDSLAIRISRHRGARELCRLVGVPLVSTSANRSGKSLIRSYEQVYTAFIGEVDYIINDSIGYQLKPSVIRDAVTGAIIRH